MLVGKIKRETQAFLGVHGEDFQILILGIVTVGHLIRLQPNDKNLGRLTNMLH